MRRAFEWSSGIKIFQDRSDLSRSLAELVLDAAERCVEAQGLFTIALSGGSTPREAHRLLGREPISRAFPWDRACFFWVDERCVAPADWASNYGNALRDFLGQVSLPPENVFPMPAELPPLEGARAYERVLSRFFDPPPGSFPRFDLTVLGLGSDGHTASLFPGHPALDETRRFVVPVRGGDPFMDRLTLTLPVLNHAARTVFMVAGRDKADAVRAVLDLEDPRLPASRVSGNRAWLVDVEAATKLSRRNGLDTPRQEGAH
ncbi:MAG: 6-phosphogluconolactonase [Deltaproteobacteria bacterium]|nr:6-phosphogluconolactonase [Deltaproteobacteria bacterium]